MRAIMCTIIVVLIIIHIAFTSIADDKRVYTRLTKKELYKLSIIKDLMSAIIIILLVLLAFI